MSQALNDTCLGCEAGTSAPFSYLTGYFPAHELSDPSHRYEYLMCFTWLSICLLSAILHQAGLMDRTVVGVLWYRWTLKERVIKLGRKNSRRTAIQGQSNDKSSLDRRRIIVFPSWGRMLLLALFISAPIVWTMIGADYIRPSAALFDMSESFPHSADFDPDDPRLTKRLEYGQGDFVAVTTLAPSTTLPYRTWWTAGSRTGAMTNAMTPFVVLIALKQVPFALLSTRLFGNLAFDKLSFLHKWAGRLVWLFATAHVGLWSVQLREDQAYGNSVWRIVFMWNKFRWGFVSYIFLTILFFMSMRPIRARFYEFFYICHVTCIVGFLVGAWLHHPPLGIWMYASLLYWLAERLCRMLKTIYINNVFMPPLQTPVIFVSNASSPSKASAPASTLPLYKCTYVTDTYTNQLAASGQRYSPNVAAFLRPGYAFVQLLPGKTMRLTLQTPRKFTWNAGQYATLNIPSLGFWQSHPFTIASACLSSNNGNGRLDEESALVAVEKREQQAVVLLIRARDGFTKQLWEHIKKQREATRRMASDDFDHFDPMKRPSKSSTGVYIRAIVDGPYGSSQRVRWGIHSTIVLICGGSGISSGIAMLEQLCNQMATSKQRHAGLLTRRIRFIWMVQEYSHLQWVASQLRKCIEMVSPEQLQVEVFVTRNNEGVKPALAERDANGFMANFTFRNHTTEDIIPLHTRNFSRSDEWQSNDEESSRAARFTEGQDQEEYGIRATDLNHYVGENDEISGAAEKKLNGQIAYEGKWRRASTRRLTLQTVSKDQRLSLLVRKLNMLPQLAYQRSVHESRANKGMHGQTSSDATMIGHDEDQTYEDIIRGETSDDTAPILKASDSYFSYNTPKRNISDPMYASETLSTDSLADICIDDEDSSRKRWTRNSAGSLISVGGITPYIDNMKEMRISVPSRYQFRKHSKMPKESTGFTGSEDDFATDMDEGESDDVKVVAELARQARPKLDIILKEEVERAQGRVLVSACGPSSLATLVKSIVSKQIDVAEVRRGNLKGHINAATFSHEWGG